MAEAFRASWCNAALSMDVDSLPSMSQRRTNSVGKPVEEPAEDDEDEPVEIPAFSIEDRQQRVVLSMGFWSTLLKSDFSVASAFVVCYMMPHILGMRIAWENWKVSGFNLWHLFVTVSKSIPDLTTAPDELDRRSNASTFIAMVLYPALGVWTSLRYSQADNLVVFQRDGLYQWGTIFPIMMWGMSALILKRESTHSITVDQSAVVTNKDGNAALGLFRRYPTGMERLSSHIGNFLTNSVWQLLPADLRPAGGVGRFVFQLFAPVVFLFLYIGLRFILYSAQEMQRLISCYPTVCLDDFEGAFPISTEAIFFIWIVFTFYCVAIRAFVPSSLFLRLTVSDEQTRKWLAPRWPLACVESKRQRVLWAFRGLANAFVPYYYTCKTPDKVDGAVDRILWYLYFGVYVSFLMEGVGALWFALHEAERSCHLKTPFLFFMKHSFWGAYNTFLQPLGTLVNLTFALVNGELRTKLKMRELFGPLLNDRGEFRSWLWKRRVQASKLSQAELDEWIATWKRKREAVGKSTDTLDIVGTTEPPPAWSAPAVFEGTVFPTWHERLHMMEHHRDYISLKPWEQHESEEKFERWHPTYREEVMGFLAEPYNFAKFREVWVFGYGSLMSPDSPAAGLSDRQRKLFLPYWIKKEAGYQRVWNYRHGSVGINAVGLQKMPEGAGDDICGIAYPMDYEFASDLFSKREDGYRLLLLHEDMMEPMHKDYRIPKGAGYIWIVGEPILKCKSPENRLCQNFMCKRHWPTDDSPILQSYVDEIISGCLKYKTQTGKNDGMNFAAAVIRSIHGWERSWFNDRILAGRPWKFAADYELTDGLLNTCPTSHAGFVKRLRPLMGQSRVLGRLYEDAFQNTEAWRAQFYAKGTDDLRWASSASSSLPPSELTIVRQELL